MERKFVKKGYIIEQDCDGDADNYLRWVISTPDGVILAREVYDYDLNRVLRSLPDLNKQKKVEKKLVIIMNAKEGDTNHICNEVDCPFYHEKEDGSMGTFCETFWSTPPVGKSSLASLCNYYDVQNVIIAEVDGNATIDEIIEGSEKICLSKVEEIPQPKTFRIESFHTTSPRGDWYWYATIENNEIVAIGHEEGNYSGGEHANTDDIKHLHEFVKWMGGANAPLAARNLYNKIKDYKLPPIKEEEYPF